MATDHIKNYYKLLELTGSILCPISGSHKHVLQELKW